MRKKTSVIWIKKNKTFKQDLCERATEQPKRIEDDEPWKNWKFSDKVAVNVVKQLASFDEPVTEFEEENNRG
jgi:hypothetical protein